MRGDLRIREDYCRIRCLISSNSVTEKDSLGNTRSESPGANGDMAGDRLTYEFHKLCAYMMVRISWLGVSLGCAYNGDLEGLERQLNGMTGSSERS